MYLLTYVGGFFNGLTVIITGWVATFSIPRLYRDNQVSVKCLTFQKNILLYNDFIISRKKSMKYFFL